MVNASIEGESVPCFKLIIKTLNVQNRNVVVRNKNKNKNIRKCTLLLYYIFGSSRIFSGFHIFFCP